MFRLLKTLCTLVGFCVLLLGGAYLIRDSLSRKLIEWSAYQLTSFPLFITENKIPAQLPIKIICSNLLLKNPIDFPLPQAALLSQIELQLAQKPWTKSQLQIANLSINIDELVLVKTTSAGDNFNRLTQTSKNSSYLFDWIKIQQFQFSLNQILYYDYTKATAPSPSTYRFEGTCHRYDKPVTLKQVPALILDYVTQQIPAAGGNTL